MLMLEYRYDTQLLIDGENLDEDAISDYFTENLKGDCLLAVGGGPLVKIHFHTNEPWKVLEYCSTLGEIYEHSGGGYGEAVPRAEGLNWAKLKAGCAPAFCLKKLPRELIPSPVRVLRESRVIVVTPVEEYVLAVRL